MFGGAPLPGGRAGLENFGRKRLGQKLSSGNLGGGRKK